MSDRQNEITASCPVPSASGLIENPGFARTELMQYARENVRAPWYRRKEWDYYLFNTDEIALAFTISDLGYVGLLSASFLDLKNRTEHTESDIVLLPRGKKFGLGTRVADAHAEYRGKRLDMVFSGEDGKRHISCVFRKFDGDKELRAELDVYPTNPEALYIATPWKEKPTAFYYNCKMNCLEAEGTVTYGTRSVSLNRESCSGVLDWGRGVWTYDNTWLWGTGSGRLNGEPFGFNLGYGFSDRSAASENALYYRGKIHKLSQVHFGIPTTPEGKREYLKPWKISSDDGRFEGTFTPILDRAACMDFKLIVSDQHQVFGRMNARTVTEEGEVLEIRDFLCALEEVRNKY